MPAQRLLVTGGGTGGHISPALAIAKAWMAHHAENELLYLGNESSLEAKLVPQEGFRFAPLRFSGMPRRLNPVAWAGWFGALGPAVFAAMERLIQFKPHVVFATGGYVTAPVLMAAQALRIPYVIHEPDAMPGLVNRLMGWGAAGITAAFEESARHFPHDKLAITGNPLRFPSQALSKAEALQRLHLDWPVERPVLSVVGGSQGARTLNQATLAALPRLVEELGLSVVHQCGAKRYEEMQDALQRVDLPPELSCYYHLQPFYSDMEALWSASDLALCRAGSLSLSELYLSQTPSILVPYPYAAADHQMKNARASERAGASLVLADADCNADSVFTALAGLLQAPQGLKRMQEAAAQLAKPHAKDAILRRLFQISG